MVLPNGSIKIIDRAKNIFKLSQGEYIAPEKLENVYIQSPYVGQIFVHGDSLQSWLVAVVVPELGPCKKLAQDLKIMTEEETDVTPHLENPELHKAIIENFNALAKSNKFSGLEKIKKMYLTPEPFSIENDVLTPTMKIKRNVAKIVYTEQIDAMYASQ